PKEWTIEFEDTSPNREGAPALYAYISNVLDRERGSEAYFDNVLITPNAAGAAPHAGPQNAKLAAPPPERVKTIREQLEEAIKVRDDPRVPASRSARAVPDRNALDRANSQSGTAGPVLGTPVGAKPGAAPQDGKVMTAQAIIAQAIVVREGQPLD